MDPRIVSIKKEILEDGTIDWVDIAQVGDFARTTLYGERLLDGFPEDDDSSVESLADRRDEWRARQEREALPLGIVAVKELLREGLIEIGEVNKGFRAWVGSVQELEMRIDSAVEDAVYPLLPGYLFWIRNTPSGDQLAESGTNRE